MRKFSISLASVAALALVGGLVILMQQPGTPSQADIGTNDVPDGFLTEEQAAGIYSDLAQPYQDDLPVGESISDALTRYDEPVSEANLVTPYGGEVEEPVVLYEIGAVEAQAAFQWLCAWEVEALEAHYANDSDAWKIAIDKVGSFTELDWYKDHVIDEENHWYNTVVSPALHGDVTGLEQDIKLCNSK